MCRVKVKIIKLHSTLSQRLPDTEIPKENILFIKSFYSDKFDTQQREEMGESEFQV